MTGLSLSANHQMYLRENNNTHVSNCFRQCLSQIKGKSIGDWYNTYIRLEGPSAQDPFKNPGKNIVIGPRRNTQRSSMVA